ncbi:transposase [Catellatospora tritici]|uniref:transposase n=1 Tax=Catellatospora tritici TaxID=2851566 RepID=UPI001C2D3FC3|nr:transposase [Catellatospora tritici]
MQALQGLLRRRAPAGVTRAPGPGPVRASPPDRFGADASGELGEGGQHVHLACDGRGRTLAFVLSGGQVSDFTAFEQLMAAIRVPRIGPGRPRVRPDHAIADKTSHAF